MRLLNILYLTGSALAFPAPTPTPTPAHLEIRDPTTDATPSSTPAPEGIFYTTKLNVIPGITNDFVTNPAKTFAIVIPTCIQTEIPDKNGYVPPGTCGALFDYYPSFGAAAAFTIIFSALTGALIFLAVKHKAGYTWPLITSALWEAIAFFTRTLSTKDQQNTGLALVSQLFILLAPLLTNAFAYLLLGRLIYFYHPTRSLFSLPAQTFALIFVSLDLVAFVIQLVGGSYAGPTAPPEQVMKGIHIYMGGIGLQQFFIFVFLGLAVKFQMEMRRDARYSALSGGKPAWRKLLWMIYLSLGFITVRIFFRLVQFSAGSEASSSKLVSVEAYLYVFEAVPMALAILVFLIIHPGKIFPRGEKMPGLWSLIKGWCCCCCGNKRKTQMVGDGKVQDGFEMRNGGYVEFGQRR